MITGAESSAMTASEKNVYIVVLNHQAENKCLPFCSEGVLESSHCRFRQPRLSFPRWSQNIKSERVAGLTSRRGIYLCHYGLLSCYQLVTLVVSENEAQAPEFLASDVFALSIGSLKHICGNGITWLEPAGSISRAVLVCLL